MKSLKISENCKYYLMFLVFSIISVFFIEFSYYFSLHSTLSWISHNIYLFVISVLVIMNFMVLLFALFRNLALAIYIPTLMSVSYGVGLFFKLAYRESPALPYELTMIFDLKEMLTFLNSQQRIAVYIIAVVFITLLVLMFKYVKRKELTKEFRAANIVLSLYVITMLINYNSKNTLLFLIVNLAFASYILYAILKSNNKLHYKVILSLVVFAVVLPSYNGNTVKKLVSYKAVYPNGDFAFKNFKVDGVIPAFLSYISLEYIAEPENYSKEEVANIVDKYKEIERTQNLSKTDIKNINPNIVFVMSESLSDPKNVENISINMNPLPNLDAYRKTYFSGTTIAQGFGGGTNMSEFEALTGVSSMFLNNAMFFNNIENRTEFPSIVSVLEGQGYQSAAVHFNSPLFYNRSTGYENLGIDHFYSDEELELDFYDNNKSYSNDESSFNEVLKLLEEYDKPTFIHNVTIQNHGPYPFEISNNQYKVDGLYKSEKKAEAETYYKEIEHTDEQLKVFLDSLDVFDEPTIVVFWGDHLPYFYDDVDFGEDSMDKYRTPLLVYSNFSTGGEDIGEISMNYISNSVFGMFNFKEPAYYYLLNDLQNKSNVLQGFHIEQDPSNLYSKYKNNEEIDAETDQIIKDYEMILYDIFLGENYSVEMGFFDIEN